MRVAIVHDWLVDSGGAEKVLHQIIGIFPSADIFASVYYLNETHKVIVHNKDVKTSFIQKLPGSKSYKKYLPLMPLAMESLDFSDYDVVISSSSAVAKGIITGPDQLHICYCHSPMRYAWDLQNQYLKESKLLSGVLGVCARYMLFKLRNWDFRSAAGVDYYIANSNYISRRIKKCYRRSAHVIYPNVDVDDFTLVEEKSDYYFTCSRLVPYKRIDLIVDAFSQMPNKKLIVVGDGPEMNKIKSKSSVNVELKGYQSFSELKSLMENAKAFVFAAEEDFGIVPVEAQACGTPVIAYGKGGALETVVDGKTGVFFNQQSVSSLKLAVERFEEMEDQFDCKAIRQHAELFNTNRFCMEFKAFVDQKVMEYF